MKSLLISSEYFPPQIGGISHLMEGIAESLGPDQVCCLTGAPADGRTRSSRVTVYRRPMAFAKSNVRQAVAWGLTISEIMARERPQVVQLATAADGYLGLWIQKWFGLPFIVYAHGNEILRALRENWDKPQRSLRSADRVVANSRFTADLVQEVGVSPERIEIVHPGCDVDLFRPLELERGVRERTLGIGHHGPVVLTVGGLVARKGHDMVIRALPRLIETIPDVTYLIVGDGPHRDTLISLAESTGVRDRVVFLGHVTEDALPEIYALSDVFVMPSREHLERSDVEGFGLVFLEANACGKPVVGGRSGGIPDAVEEGVTGLLVDPRDPEEIASALARLLANRDLAIQMGRQGQSRVLRDFTWPRVAGRIQRVVESVYEQTKAVV
jgi:phosphatidylinositol alpha-1,6-mannosyltransferase